jgi:hypothetical protein
MISVTIPIQIYHNQAAALDNVYKIAEALNWYFQPWCKELNLLLILTIMRLTEGLHKWKAHMHYKFVLRE